MDPDVIRSFKQAALDPDRSASDIMEEAGKQWLQPKTNKARSASAGGDHRIIGKNCPDAALEVFAVFGDAFAIIVGLSTRTIKAGD